MLSEVDDYYWLMAARHRLIMVRHGIQVVATCTYFILQSLDEIPRFYDRPMWSLPSDAMDGPVVYIDKLMGLMWNKQIRQQLEALLAQQVPSFRVGVWYRPGHGHLPDRRYTCGRHAIGGVTNGKEL